MSYLLDGINQHLLRNETPLGDEPLTFMVWFKTTSQNLAQMLIDLGNTVSLNNSWAMLIAGNIAGDPVQVQTRDVAGSAAASTAPYTANQWECAIGVIASDTDRRSFIDGGAKGVNATARAVAAAIAQVRLGLGTTGLSPFVGRIAEVAIWNVALSDADVALMAAGRSPMSLATPPIRYYRLKTNLLDINGVNGLTAVNGPVLDADHPAVDDPPGPPPAVPGGSMSVSGGGKINTAGMKRGIGGAAISVSGSVTFQGARVGPGVRGGSMGVSGGGRVTITGLKRSSGATSVTGGGTVRFTGQEVVPEAPPELGPALWPCPNIYCGGVYQPRGMMHAPADVDPNHVPPTRVTLYCDTCDFTYEAPIYGPEVLKP